MISNSHCYQKLIKNMPNKSILSDNYLLDNIIKSLYKLLTQVIIKKLISRIRRIRSSIG